MLERIMPLGDRHGAAVKPAVGDFGDAAHNAAVGRVPGQPVDIRPVQVQVFELMTDLLFQFGHTADALGVRAPRRVAAPDGQGRAPVAVAAQRPVHVVFQPLAEASGLGVLRIPVNLLIQGDQTVAIGAGADEPGLLGPVEQGRIAAPAERIRMLVFARSVQQTACGQFFLDGRVRVLDEYAGPRRHFCLEFALSIYGLDDGQAVLGPHGHVVGSERGRDVNDPCPFVGADEVARHNVAVIDLLRIEGVQRLVVNAQQVAALQTLGHLVSGIQHGVHQVGGQDQQVAAGVAHLDVVQVFADGQGHIARQRPRRRGPGQQVRGFRISHPELHEDAGVNGSFLVAQRKLMAAQRRAAARAVGHHLVTEIEHVPVPELLEYPPQRFDVLVVEGDVGMLQIDPECHTLGEPLPVFDVLLGGGATAAVELLDAEVLDLLFATETKLLLDLDLDGQAVGVPAAAPLAIVALHDLVAREDVLEGTR